jgi:hypothetical protein
MDESTTDASVQEQAAQVPQPEEQHAEAEKTPTSEPTNTNDEPAVEEPAKAENSEEQLDPAAFWAKKGIDITTPEGLAKATQSYSESEKRMHETTQRSSQLEKQLEQSPYEQVSDDPTAQRALETASAVQLELKVERWKNANKITPDQDVALGEYLQKNEEKAFMLKNGYLSLDDVYAMSGVGKADTTAIKDEGKREALEQLANKQRSTAPRGAATTSTTPEVDPILEALRSN